MTSVETACRILKRFSYPIGVNMTERWMIERIYQQEMALKHLRFISVVLLGFGSVGCTARATANQAVVAAPVTCKTPIVVITTLAQDANEHPVSIGSARTKPPICLCSDSITVRACQ